MLAASGLDLELNQELVCQKDRPHAELVALGTNMHTLTSVSVYCVWEDSIAVLEGMVI